ncbi:MAG: methyltransferase domain-containing protein [Alphaproteobacteria bacterium]
MSDAVTVFDRAAVRHHRDRAAACFGAHDFLFREVAKRLAERLDDIRRDFPAALDLGCHAGAFAGALAGRGGVARLVQADLSPAMLARARGLRVAADEELLPFAGASFDLVASVLSLHWVNDLPGALAQLCRALRPDGLLLAALFGVGTLGELREAFAAAEIAAEAGLSPRLSPFVEVRDAGALLLRAGFALPVVDVDTIAVSYPDALALMRDLRGMGETNALVERSRRPTPRATIAAVAAAYAKRFAGADGRIPATFEVVYLTAWAPHASQQRPLRPGSAQARLADALDTTEVPAGDKTRPR